MNQPNRNPLTVELWWWHEESVDRRELRAGARWRARLRGFFIRCPCPFPRKQRLWQRRLNDMKIEKFQKNKFEKQNRKLTRGTFQKHKNWIWKTEFRKFCNTSTIVKIKWKTAVTTMSPHTKAEDSNNEDRSAEEQSSVAGRWIKSFDAWKTNSDTRQRLAVTPLNSSLT